MYTMTKTATNSVIGKLIELTGNQSSTSISTEKKEEFCVHYFSLGKVYNYETAFRNTDGDSVVWGVTKEGEPTLEVNYKHEWLDEEEIIRSVLNINSDDSHNCWSNLLLMALKDAPLKSIASLEEETRKMTGEITHKRVMQAFTKLCL